MSKIIFIYEYDPYQITGTALICITSSYTTIALLQNTKYSTRLSTFVFMIALSSISLSILSVWSTHFLLINSIVFKDILLYLDIKITFYSMIASITLNVIGFYISFIPYLKRIILKYKIEVNNKCNEFEETETELNRIADIRKEIKAPNLNIENTNGYNMNRPRENEITINKEFKLEKKYLKTENRNFKVIEECEKSKNNINSNLSLSESENKQYEQENNLKNAIKHFENIRFATYFEKQKLTTREFIYLFFAALLITPSTMVLHMIGMFALKTKGDIDFFNNLQILIGLLGLIIPLIVHFAFYYNGNFILKIFLSIMLTIIIFLIHCISMKYVIFYKNDNDTTDYSYLDSNSSIITVSNISKIVLFVNSVLSYFFREISYYLSKHSWKIDFETFINSDNSKKLNYLNNVVHKKYNIDSNMNYRKERDFEIKLNKSDKYVPKELKKLNNFFISEK